MNTDNFKPGDKFKYKAENGLGFGVVISYDRALLINDGGREGHSLERNTVPGNALPLREGDPVPYEIELALKAASMVLDC